MLNIGQTHPLLGLLDSPGKRLSEGFARDGTTGLADGHQACLSPLEGAVVLHLAHQSGVHHHDEVHVPGLAQSVTQVTVTHAQMLLPVPMIGLGSGPASLVDLQDAVGFPVDAVGNQHFACLRRVSARPEHKHAHPVVDVGDANGLGEVPLGVVADGELGAHKRSQGLGPGAHRGRLPADRDHAIELQVADVAPTVSLDVVHDWPVGEVTVEGEITRNVLSHNPIDQLLREVGVVLEGMGVIALLALAGAPEVERIVLSGGVHVVDEQVIVGDAVPLVSVVPEPADILDQLPVVVNQRVVEWNDTVLAVAGGRVVLQPFEALRIQTVGFPRRLGQEAVQARLVGRVGELTRNATDRFAFGDQQARQVLGEVNPCWLVRKDVSELKEQLFDDLR